jgi:hypothetical protein
MRDRAEKARRRAAAGWAITLAIALALGWSTGAFAQNAAEDEEEVPLDTKLLRQFMKDLGLQRNGDGIEFRERAPLVVPPSRNLPPPRSEPSYTANPAWPKDPDVTQRKADATKKKLPARTAAEVMDHDGRPLSRDELEKGRLPAGMKAGGSSTPEESGRAMKPSELGSKSIFSDMFSAIGPEKPETAEFTGEPVRESLTKPPPGYQTPSANAPYGFDPRSNKEKNNAKALTVEDRAVSSGGTPR